MANNDIELSNMSFVQKDFSSIYSELLDLAKQLTNKWDPSQSNESDPGVVLLKEAAATADHVNYNVDKNILEGFLPSATQDKSVRNILEMNGYVPQYYVSATGPVTVKWNPSESDSDESTTEITSFVIPALTLVVTDADGEYTFTQLEDIPITAKGVSASGKFIEGTLQELTINGASVITLDNLDNNNRIYLPDKMIAQNGIFISNKETSDYSGFWERDNYLLTRPNNSRVFKLDYDSSKGLPYIEFPSDIANIIGGGLYIRYVATSGINGNVSANKLEKISSPDKITIKISEETSVDISTEDLEVGNTGSILNGKDPETIDEMYRSFKKVVGTFDTLVTSSDYSNKVRTLADSYDTNYVSNAYVTDRRTDYNYSANVVTYDMYREFFENISLKKCTLRFRGVGTDPSSITPIKGDLYYVMESSEAVIYTQGLYYFDGTRWNIVAGNVINLNDFTILTEAMTPYDLIIYALTAFSLSEFNSAAPAAALNNSFKPIDCGETVKSTTNFITSAIKGEKCISHNFKQVQDSDIFCFKNYVPLNVTIQPFNKVTREEKNEIVTNIYRELTRNFNAHELEFGEELNYNAVHDVIVGADTRISDAYVRPFEYNPKVMLGNGNDYSLTNTMYNSSYSYLVDLVSKNILAGRVCLFNFDNDFTYKYGQTDAAIFSDISKIVTKIPIDITSTSVTSRVLSQENIETNVNVTCTIQSGTASNPNVRYSFYAPSLNGQNLPLSRGSSYEFEAGAYLTLKVKKDGVTTTTTYQNANGITYTLTNVLNETTQTIAGYTTSLLTDGTEVDLLSRGTLTINAITTTTVSEGSDQNLNYTLKDNEFIQIIYPNYYEDSSYGSYVYYRYEDNASSGDPRVIPANTVYTLSTGQEIILQYTVDNVTTTDRLVAGDVIKSSVELSTISSGVDKTWYKNGSKVTAAFAQLTASQSICKMARMETVLDSSYMKCYWITDDVKDNRMYLFGEGNNLYTRILGNNEYFVYANSSLDEIMILGSGTKLIRSHEDTRNWSVKNTDITIGTIAENGTNTTLDWQVFDFSTHNLLIDEMNITTLASGDNIVINGWSRAGSSEKWVIDNDWQDIYATISYTSNGTTTTLPAILDFYQIRSRLDLAMSPTVSQTLKADLVVESSETTTYKNVQSITVYWGNGFTTIEGDEEGVSVQASQVLDLVGGDIINLSDFVKLGLVLNMFKYKTTTIQLTKTPTSESSESGTVESIDKKELGYVVEIDPLETGELILPFHYSSTYSYTENKKRMYILPVYVYGDEVDITATVTTSRDMSGSIVGVGEFNSGASSFSSNILIRGSGMTYIELSDKIMSSPPQSVPDGELYLHLSWDTTSQLEFNSYNVMVIDEYFAIKGTKVSDTVYNYLLPKVANSGVAYRDVCGRIREIIANSDKPTLKPYYTYTPENGMAINDPDFSRPDIMWDTNNVANILTIPQIDISNSEIDIATAMRLY